ncbi:alcohol dehydrogenase catalytic domain-containing protein [Rathayibacter sp. YIM 133350]|uniref:alcohol dehydrogenase catalytic domain-containing protein n=1 Tax=Rathayibacter sp. YIM 133350 TaxID=3131992 RepID=UPI00307F5D15
MQAVTWQGKRSVAVEQVEHPRLIEPTDAIVEITSTAICGSDLHLYELMAPFLEKGDIVGHEAMGVVTAVGDDVSAVRVNDRVVIACQLACGRCYMCERGLQSQCETTQVHDYDMAGALFGYSKLYGHVPGLQAGAARVPFADHTLIPVGPDLPDERYLFLGDVLPTAWQGVQYADIPSGATVAVLGLGPIGQMAARMARHLGHRVLGVDAVPERRAMAQRHGIETFDETDDLLAVLRSATDGRGPASVIDAVGTEAHGDTVAALAQEAGSVLPKPIGRAMITHAGVDRMAALHFAIELVQRGGTVSLTGAYTGAADPMPLLKVWDKELTLRGGPVNVRRWVDDLMPLVEDAADPLGLTDLVTHRAAIEEAPRLYEIFQKKQDGCIKVVLKP